MWQSLGGGDDRIHGALRMDMSWSEGGRLLRTGQARSGRGAGACTAGEGAERVIDYKAMAEFAHANGEECVSDPDDRNLLTEPSAHTVDSGKMGAYPETAS